MKVMLRVAVWMLLLLSPLWTLAQFEFSDNAASYGGTWANGDNQGSGYNAWTITTGGASSGTFIANPAGNGMGTAGIGTTAFGLFGHSGQFVNATRYFGAGGTNVPMQIGDIFSFYWAMNWDAGAGSKGFNLRADGAMIFNVNNGGSANIQTSNGSADGNPGTAPMLVTLTRTSWTQYTFTMTRRSDGTTYSTTINSTEDINNINIYCGGQPDDNGNRNIYFNVFNFTKAEPYQTNFGLTDPRILTGASNLTKTGTGNLTLNAANTFTGNTIVNENFLIIGNDNRLGAVPGSATPGKIQIGGGTLGISANLTLNANRGITLTNANSTIDVFGGQTATYNGIFEGSGAHGLTKAGPGTLVVGGNSTYTGSTTIATGILRINTDQGLGTATGNTTVNDGAVLEINGALAIAEPIILNGFGITNGGALRKIGTGAANLSGTITCNNDSRLMSAAGTTNLTGELNLSGNTLYIGGTTAINMTGAGSFISNATKTAGDGAIFKDGSNIFLLRPSNDLTGDIRLVQGTFRVGANSSGTGIPSGGTFFISNGTNLSSDGTTTRIVNKNIQLLGNVTLANNSTGGLTFNGEFNLTSDTRTVTISNPCTVTGVVLNGGLSKAGTGILTLSGTTANTYNGTTTVNAGTLILSKSADIAAITGPLIIGDGTTLRTDANNQWGTGTPPLVTINGSGLLNLNNTDQRIALASVNASAQIDLGSGMLTIDNTGTDIYAGSITGTGGVAKVNSGTQVLSNPGNDYTGATTVSGGILRAGAANVFPSASNLILNGGTLSTGNTVGFNQVLGTLEVTANSSIALGTGIHTLTFDASDAVTWAEGAILTITGWVGAEESSGTAGRIFVGSDDTGLTLEQLYNIDFDGVGLGALLLSTGELVPRTPTTQRFDSFNRPNNSVIGEAPVTPPAGNWAELFNYFGGCNPSNPSNYTIIDANQVQMTNCIAGDATCPGSGHRGSKQIVFDAEALYPSRFAEAGQTMEWYFNMKQSRTDPSGFGTNSYGVAFVLGCTSEDFRDAGAEGYAVVLGESATNDPIRLIHFTGGLTQTAFSTNTVVSITPSGNRNNFYSISVRFDPCTDTWELSVRDDGNSNFKDPISVTPSGVTGVDQTHVLKELPYMGGMFVHGDGCTEEALFDNFYIPNSNNNPRTFAWTGSVNTNFQTAGNWSPVRSSPCGNDRLEFAGTHEIINVPSMQVAQIEVQENADIRWVNALAGTASVINVRGAAGVDFEIEENAIFRLDVPNPTLNSGIQLSVLRGSTAQITGTLRMQNTPGTAGMLHRLYGLEAGNIRILNKGVVSAANVSGNPFGGDTGDPELSLQETVIFEAGSAFEHIRSANPFGLAQPASKVLFEPGSWYYWRSNEATIGVVPSMTGRTYANLDYDSPHGKTATSGIEDYTIDTLRISQSSFNINLNVDGNILGDIIVESGATLGFLPPTAGRVLLAGNKIQTISGDGTLNFGPQLEVLVNNTSASEPSVLFHKNLVFNHHLRVNDGILGNLSGTERSITITGTNKELEVNSAIRGTNIGLGNNLGLIIAGPEVRVVGNTGAECLFFNVDVQDNNVLALQRGNFDVRFGTFSVQDNATLRIDANGGMANTSLSPTYAATANLVYNSGGNYNRFLEWAGTANPGFPGNVVIQNGTSLNLASPPVNLGVNNDLTLGNSAGIGNLTMGATGNSLSVGGDLFIGGPSGTSTLTQGTEAGADVFVAGNYVQNNNGALVQNNRELVMNGTGVQNMSSILTFENLAIDNNGGSVIPNTSITILNRLRLSNGILDLSSSSSVTMDANALILRTSASAFMTEEPSTAGDRYNIEYTAAMVTDKEWSSNEDAVSDVHINGNFTLTLDENRALNRNLDLDGGNLNLGGNTLKLLGKAGSIGTAASIFIREGGVRNVFGGSPGAKFMIVGEEADDNTGFTRKVFVEDGALLNFDSDITVSIGNGGMDFGLFNPVTIFGVLEVLTGGFAVNNACRYAVNSVLRFANQIDYQVNATDITWAGGAIGSGEPGIPYNVEVLDTGSDLNINAPRALENNLTISNGIFTLNITGGDFSLGGNWSRSGGTSNFIPNTQRVIFNGSTGAQTIDVPTGETFYGLEVNNPDGLNLTGDVNIVDEFIFTSGIVSSGSNTVTFESTADATGASNLSHVDGLVRKEGSTDFLFPIGDMNYYQPLEIRNITGTTPAFQARYFAEAHPTLIGQDFYGSPQQPVSTCDYWSLNEDTGSQARVYLTYGNNPCVVVGSEPEAYEAVDIAWYNPFNFAWGPPEPQAIDPATFGTVGTTQVLDAYGFFALASTAGNLNVLPITLLSFSAELVDGPVVNTAWSTASEINNDFFTVERSVDGQRWEAVGTVDGAGNSNTVLHYTFADDAPHKGLSYYRLRQTDFDGTTTTSQVEAVYVGDDQDDFALVQVYRSDAGLDFRYKASAPYLTLEVYDLSGRLIHGGVLANDEGGIGRIDVNLARGVYVFKLSDNYGNVAAERFFW